MVVSRPCPAPTAATPPPVTKDRFAMRRCRLDCRAAAQSESPADGSCGCGHRRSLVTGCCSTTCGQMSCLYVGQHGLRASQRSAALPRPADDAVGRGCGSCGRSCSCLPPTVVRLLRAVSSGATASARMESQCALQCRRASGPCTVTSGAPAVERVNCGPEQARLNGWIGMN